ncbi:MAG: hypothetical protein V1821_02035 [bacterium]
MWRSRASNLSEAILETLGYFTLFEYPLAPLEIWKYLFFQAEYREVLSSLETLVLERRIIEEDGKYTLPGQDRNFSARAAAYQTSLPKIESARRSAWYLKRCPFVKAVFVCNSLALMNATKESDIDFFIVTSKGAVWRARLFSVFPFVLLGQRPKGWSGSRSFCFSFFLSEDNLNVSRFKIGERDPYLAIWLASLLALYDPDGMISKLWLQSGSMDILPQLRDWPVEATGTVHGVKQALERRFPDWLETASEKIERWYLPQEIKNRIGRDTAVVIDHQAIKIHSPDRRREFLNRFEEILRTLGV